MAEDKDDSVVQTFDDRDEELAHLAFVGADIAGECVNMFHDGIRVRGDWTRTRGGRRVHKSCLDNYNETMDCGIDRGGCSDPRCWLADVAVELVAQPDLEALGLEGIEDELWAMLDGLLTVWIAEFAHHSAVLRGGPVVAGPTWTGGPEGARISIERALGKCGQSYDELPPRVAAELYTRWVCEYEEAMACWGLDAE